MGSDDALSDVELKFQKKVADEKARRLQRIAEDELLKDQIARGEYQLSPHLRGVDVDDIDELWSMLTSGTVTVRDINAQYGLKNNLYKLRGKADTALSDLRTSGEEMMHIFTAFPRLNWRSILPTFDGHFMAMRILELYLAAPNEVLMLSDIEEVVYKLVTDGFSISGLRLTSFEGYIDHLRRTIVPLNDPSRNTRLDRYLDHFLSYYRDIPVLMEYRWSLSHEEGTVVQKFTTSATTLNRPIETYTGRTANTYKRQGGPLHQRRVRPTRKESQLISIMDSNIRNAPRTTQPLFFWRGVNASLPEGLDVTVETFKSLSLSPEIASIFGSELMRILIPIGVPLLYAGHGGENEYILPRGAHFIYQGLQPTQTSSPYHTYIVDYDSARDAEFYGRLRSASD